jgi:hypothetical protein
VSLIAHHDPSTPGFGAIQCRVLDAASGTFGVRLRLPNQTLNLPAGIRCRIEFQLQPARTKGFEVDAK